MKEIGYHIFAFFFRLYSFLGIDENRVFLVMTHDDGREGNVGTVLTYLKKNKSDLKYARVTRKGTDFKGEKKAWRALRFFLRTSYEIARSKYIFLDNVFLPLAFCKVQDKVKVIQLWHGTGTIKKFGQDVNEGRLKELEKRANQKITDLVVNSDETKKLYAGCFGISENKVRVFGLPRTDVFFNKRVQQKKLEEFYTEYPELKDKKIILYAPTFRDDELVHPSIAFSIDKLMEQMDENVCLALRLHPFVAYSIPYEGKYKNRVYDFSLYNKLNTLLFATDCLVTDYSSIIFEYVALNRPMVFYAYDLDEFKKDGRGFYNEYETYVPGPVVQSEKELIEALKKESINQEEIEKFRKRAYAYTDGRATKRLIDKIFNEK
ncbi:MAG: CDP-glycerol glycerophosphotransferase family protein [Lachnospiraceae bacterium]